MKLSLCRIVPLLLLTLPGCEGADAGMRPDDGLPPLPQPGWAYVIFGTDTVNAEVAETSQQHAQGLMGRTSLPPGEGMLFVFDREAFRAFWMKDTLIPLDIAFLNRLFEVVDIQQMEPLSEELHTSAAPAMYALEVPSGWFALQGIGVGAQAQVLFGPP